MIADKSIKTSEQSQAINANVDTPPAPPNGSRDVRHGTIPHPSTPDTSNWPLQTVTGLGNWARMVSNQSENYQGDLLKDFSDIDFGDKLIVIPLRRRIFGHRSEVVVKSRYPKDILLKVMDR